MKFHLTIRIPDEDLHVFLRETDSAITEGDLISLNVGHHAFHARLIDASGAQVVIATGNPFDGLTLTGTFADDTTAIEYAEREDLETWWIADVHAPENNG